METVVKMLADGNISDIRPIAVVAAAWLRECDAMFCSANSRLTPRVDHVAQVIIPELVEPIPEFGFRFSHHLDHLKSLRSVPQANPSSGAVQSGATVSRRHQAYRRRVGASMAKRPIAPLRVSFQQLSDNVTYVTGSPRTP
jgi:hypothetical protein